MLLKIAPDLEDGGDAGNRRCCMNSAVDGVIVSNTTISRPPLHSRDAEETGGLSGAPLFDLSTLQLARFYILTKGKIPLWGPAGYPMRIRPGPRFAPAPRCCSFIPPWFSRAGIGAGHPRRPSRKLEENKFGAWATPWALSRRIAHQSPARQIARENSRKFPFPAAGRGHSQSLDRFLVVLRARKERLRLKNCRST